MLFNSGESAIRLAIRPTDPLSFTGDYPIGFKPYRYFGARYHIASGYFGKLFFQEVVAGEQSVQYNHYLVDSTTSFESEGKEPVLTLLFVLRNSYYTTLEGLGPRAFHEYGYNMLYEPYVNEQVMLEADRPYTLFHIRYSPGFLLRLSPYYPLLENFLNKIRQGEPAVLCPVNQIATPAMHKIIRQVVHCPYRSGLRTIYLEAKLMEMMIAIMEEVTHRPCLQPISLHKEDIQRIYTVKEYLLEHIAQPPSLDEMAKKVFLHEAKIRKGFKKIYGVSIQSFILRVRMEKAKAMLLETEYRVEEISNRLGYKRPANFIATFKEFFGYTPGAVRKNTVVPLCQD